MSSTNETSDHIATSVEQSALSALPPSPINDSRNCPECNIEMTLLGRIPNNWAHRPIMVYRCYGCDNVISVED
jgi:hypothetical protein